MASLETKPTAKETTKETNADLFLRTIWQGLTDDDTLPCAAQFRGRGPLRAAFAVADLAAASIGAVGCATSALIATHYGEAPPVTIDKRLASLWFDMTLDPKGWKAPPAWDAIAGDYRTSDGWIKLHTNAPHHKLAVIDTLFAGIADPKIDKLTVAQQVETWQADALEAAVVGRGGCAATMRTREEWASHPQGEAVATEPLFWRAQTGPSARRDWLPNKARPLAGIRVLDLTRILAGPVATRILAGLGAQVLRIDPPDWDEPSLAPEITLGKHCARLDLSADKDRETFERLLNSADILIHGYRADALGKLGFSAATRQSLCPGLIDISLNAYGWTGPWKNRRGFDSLVQMSTGIAEHGMARYAEDRPIPLPVQALDHATGYLMAAAAISGLTHRQKTGTGLRIRTSLARTAALLNTVQLKRRTGETISLNPHDFSKQTEQTAWGPANRVLPPFAIEDVQISWPIPAGPLGNTAPKW